MKIQRAVNILLIPAFILYLGQGFVYCQDRIEKIIYQTITVKSGDTLWDIARRYGTTTSSLRRLNGLGRSSRIYPGQMLKVSGSGGPEYVTHKVRRGESLSRIAKKYRTSISKILANNYLDDPDNIRVGQELRIKVK